jgi:hypothetical protein
MKHIKSFENLKGESPDVGDYVILNVNNSEPTNQKFIDFIDSHVGKVIGINPKASLTYLIEFEDIIAYYGKYEPKNTNFLRFGINEISDFSKSKQELEMKIKIKKYNL